LKTAFSHLPTWLPVLLFAFLAGNLLGLFFFPPHTDEAYYWMLSQNLGLSYFDHPPLVPWMMRSFTTILGNTEWVMRLPAVVAWVVGAWTIHRLATEVADNDKAGWMAVLVFASLPIFQAGFHIVGPDSGLMLFTALAYFFASRAVTEAKPGYWLVAGLVTGAGLLAKYNMVLAPAAIFLALLFHSHGRMELRKPWPWLAGFLALFCFTPVVIWNYQNEWASFVFQWRHGTGADTDTWIDNLIFYVVNQLGVVLPWVLIAMVVASIKIGRYAAEPGSYTLVLLRAAFWFPLLFFGFTNLLTKGHASWPAMAYLPGSVLLGVALTQWLGSSSISSEVRFRRIRIGLVIFLAVFSLLVANVVRFPTWVQAIGIGPLPNGHASNGMGWDQVVGPMARLQRQQDKLMGTHGCRAIALPGFDNYGYPYYLTAAEIGLELRNADTITAAPGSRLTQFDFWRNSEPANSPPLCVAVTGPSRSPELPEMIRNDFGQWRLEEVVGVKTPDGTIRSFGLYALVFP
jgi:4-amino-4-deoxy-L-arabinose transferase-like glycosyltransferase